jgi:hypothetical protein
MDWIEQVFGIVPDGGSGTLELAVFALLLLAAVVAASWRQVRRKSGRPNGRYPRFSPFYPRKNDKESNAQLDNHCRTAMPKRILVLAVKDTPPTAGRRSG